MSNDYVNVRIERDSLICNAEGTDLDASIDAFETAVTAALARALGDHVAITVTIGDIESVTDGSDDELEEHANIVAGRVFSDGRFWVELPESTTHTIAGTKSWTEKPREGDTLVTEEDCDARDWDSFRRELAAANLTYVFDSHDIETGLDTYDIVPAKAGR